MLDACGADVAHFHLANPFAFPTLRAETGDVMRRAKDTGLTTSMDTGWDSKGRWMLDVGSALPATDLLFVNEAEARGCSVCRECATFANAAGAMNVEQIGAITGVRSFKETLASMRSRKNLLTCLQL